MAARDKTTKNNCNVRLLQVILLGLAENRKEVPFHRSFCIYLRRSERLHVNFWYDQFDPWNRPDRSTEDANRHRVF